MKKRKELFKAARIREMPFFEKMQPFIGKKIKKISMVNEGGQELVAMIFNDRFGSALYFTKNGKFVIHGPTTKYVAYRKAKPSR